MIAWPTAKLNMRRRILRVRFAWIGAPRSTISFSRRTISRRVMSFAFRPPQRESTSLRKIRSSSAALRFRTRAYRSR